MLLNHASLTLDILQEIKNNIIRKTKVQQESASTGATTSLNIDQA